MRRFLPELAALPMLPFLIAQGKHTRRVTPRLPEASGPVEGVAGASQPGAPLSLLTVGESPVAGVGVGTHEEAITGQLAQALALRMQRPVAWRACGKNGVTAREALESVMPLVPEQRVDIALVAFGVNDTTAFRPLSHWRRDLGNVLRALEQRCRPGVVLLSGVPPIAYFPALPQPLRWVMGLKAGVLDLAVRELAAEHRHIRYVPLALDTSDPSMMASDGYHPSAKGCTAWAKLLAEAGAHSLAT
ncbi:MAG TPA: SGNH/GDSL hydrolase family protein [Noviherbaspirillum sp.]|nr:SGNH/GDSL hydrolase family protein [Noviherbaspirillum sp.]